MNIDISIHARKRAKQRFRLKQSSLFRLCEKAIQEGREIIAEEYNAICYIYEHFNLIFTPKSDKLVLKTITNLDTKPDYKESLEKNVYVGGKCIGKKIILKEYV